MFTGRYNKKIFQYNTNIKERLIRDEDNVFGFHFSDEDFYIYLLAHEHKHFSGSGTGLRSLMDIYVYCREKADTLDWDYIEAELEKLGLKEFETRNRRLSLYLFGEKMADWSAVQEAFGSGITVQSTDSETSGSGTLTEEDEKMLAYILSSGTYGTAENGVRKRIEKYGTGRRAKLRYFFHRIFLPWKDVKLFYPTVARFPVLLPFLPFFRVFRGLIFRRQKMLAELNILLRKKTKE